MKTIFRRKSYFALSFLLLLFGFDQAAASKTKVISISPCDLRPVDQPSASVTWIGYSNEFNFSNLDFTKRVDADAIAAVSLPDGVNLKKLVVCYTDKGCAQAQYITVSLLHHNLATGAIELLAEVSSKGLEVDPNRKVLETSSIRHSIVNNNKYSYSLWARFTYIKRDRVKFHGAKIYYQ
jgi:hypothetical protein